MRTMFFSTLKHVGDLGVHSLEPLKQRPNFYSVSLQGSCKARASALISTLFSKRCRQIPSPIILTSKFTSGS